MNCKGTDWCRKTRAGGGAKPRNRPPPKFWKESKLKEEGIVPNVNTNSKNILFNILLQ
jgi:hypothetical protein